MTLMVRRIDEQEAVLGEEGDPVFDGESAEVGHVELFRSGLGAGAASVGVGFGKRQGLRRCRLRLAGLGGGEGGFGLVLRWCCVHRRLFDGACWRVYPTWSFASALLGSTVRFPPGRRRFR